MILCMESECLFSSFFLFWICVFPKNFDISFVVSSSFWIWNLILPPRLAAIIAGSSDRDPIPTHYLPDQWTDSYAGTLLCELVMVATDTAKGNWVGLVTSEG